ncbi:MAG TPA: haloalkane dehalogenase [Candidatus Dormibacteraeota bacterium]|nr:haloalkane dehalogenase [Candidatus Dormibacteraeota bacterium]
MRVLRTPEERFAGLPGWDDEPRYVDVGGLRVAYAESGPAGAPAVLLLHGEPTWAYLWRKVMAVLVDAGLRAIAPDLVGFGRSDKPADPADHAYDRHVAWMRTFVESLDLRQATLVGHDWGGLIGLRLVAEAGERFARVVATNTGLPTGDQHLSDAFFNWQRFSQEAPELPVGRIVAGGCREPLPPEVVAAYDAPFPDETYKAGPRRLPLLVPTSPSDPAAAANRRAWQALQRWEKPFLCVFSDGDPITRGADEPMRRLVPGARHDRHVTIAGAGHFLQEDRGEELGEAIVRFVRS